MEVVGLERDFLQELSMAIKSRVLNLEFNSEQDKWIYSISSHCSWVVMKKMVTKIVEKMDKTMAK